MLNPENQLYDKVLDDSFEKLKKSLLNDVQGEDFNWDLLIEMLIIENSPLAEIFSTKTLQFAELYHTAKHLITVAHDIDNHDNNIIDEAVRERITKADIETSKESSDDFADFEDV